MTTIAKTAVVLLLPLAALAMVGVVAHNLVSGSTVGGAL